MQISKDTDELFLRPIIHWLYLGNFSVVLVGDKLIFVSPVVCDWEPSGEVGCYILLVINDIGKDVVGACLPCFHCFVFVWGCTLSLGGNYVLPDLLHVDFYNGHGRR